MNYFGKKAKKLASITAMMLAFTCTANAAPYVNLTLTYDYTSHRYSAEEVKLSVNDSVLTNLSMPPIIFNGYTLVPAREVFEALGANVEWKKEVSQVYITYNGRLVVIPTDSDKAYVDGNSFNMAVPAKIINNKVMIPVRFVSEALGLKVDWDNSTRIVNVSDSAKAEVTTAAPVTEATTQATTQAVTQAAPQATTAAPVVTTEATTQATTAAPATAAPVTGEKHFGYDSVNGRIYIRNLNNAINIDSIVHDDDYRGLTYSLIIYGDYRNLVDNALYDVGTQYMNKIMINCDEERLKIVFDEKTIMAADVTANDEYIYIKPVTPKEKYDKIVVLDAGHGGSDPGASGNGLVEKDLTLAILLKSVEMFEANGKVKAYVSRDADFYPSFDNRTDLGNLVGDAFISIHINSAGSNSTALGTETYSLNPNDQGNGLTSYMLAEAILNNLLENLGTVNRGVKSENWIVLRQSDIPATLIEIGFITNPSDAAIMGSEDGQAKAAKAIVDAVETLFEQHPPVR